MHYDLRKLLIVLTKHTLYLFLLIVVGQSVLMARPTFGQSIHEVKISVTLDKNTIEEALDKIAAITEFKFAYGKDLKDVDVTLQEQFSNETVADVLKRISQQSGVEFRQVNGTISAKFAGDPIRSVPHQVQDTVKYLYISGVVRDEYGNTLPGATIYIKNTTHGTVTDIDGNFFIDLDAGQTIVFQFVGYLKKEITLYDQQELNVVLEEDPSELDEVLVLGYGETSQRLSTGNVTTITAKDLQKNPVNNVLQAIQGHVPGVYINQLTGQAGSPIDIQIRGKNTFSNTAEPLVIVDGVTYPYGNLPTSSNLGALTGGNALNYLDPNNIESISFLKDADATAVYGSRGSHGVILITTKKSKVGETRVAVSSKHGFSMRGSVPEMLNTEEYIAYRTEAIENAGLTPDVSDVDVNGTWPTDRDTDWGDYFLGDVAYTSANNISYSGGTDVLSYLVRANYNTEENIQNGNGSNKTGGVHFNLQTQSLDRKFSISLSGTYSATKSTIVPFNYSLLYLAPNAPEPYNEDGSLNWTDYGEFNRNPAAIFEKINNNKTDNLISNLGLKYATKNGFTFRTDVGVSILSSHEIDATPSSYYPPDSYNTNSSTLNNYKVRNITVEPFVSYEKDLNSLGMITLKAGGTLQDGLIYNQNTYGTDLLTDDLLYNPTMADDANISSTYNSTVNRYVGGFGIFNYNLQNKYLLNAHIRRDGSTKFGSKNRFGTFWSVAAGWIISEESWFKDNLGFISYAKLRGSYGTTGGDAISNYSYLTTYASSYNYNNGIGLVPSGPANPYLHWERNDKSEISLRVEFFKGRLSISESYYNTKSTDQLISYPVSIVTGVSSITKNSEAEIRNWGHEIVISTQNINSRNFSWSTDFNVTIPRNELVSLPNDQVLDNDNYKVGKPITGRKLYSYQGVNTETGNYNFWNDLNENGTMDEGEVGEWVYTDPLDYLSDRTQFVDLNPKLFGGIQNNFRYGNFNLSFFFSFTKKKAKNFLGSQVDPLGTFNINIAKSIYDARWQQPGDVADVPRITADYFDAYFGHSYFSSSTGAYSNATFARLENVNLSYTFSSDVLQKLKMKSLMLYVQGQNLLTFSKYEGFDPETVSDGALTPGLSPLRTFVFGLDLTF